MSPQVSLRTSGNFKDLFSGPWWTFRSFHGPSPALRDPKGSLGAFTDPQRSRGNFWSFQAWTIMSLDGQWTRNESSDPQRPKTSQEKRPKKTYIDLKRPVTNPPIESSQPWPVTSHKKFSGPGKIPSHSPVMIQNNFITNNFLHSLTCKEWEKD